VKWTDREAHRAEIPLPWDLWLTMVIICGVVIMGCGVLGLLLLLAIGWVEWEGIATSAVIILCGWGIVILVLCGAFGVSSLLRKDKRSG
jgi:hypothetical protein